MCPTLTLPDQGNEPKTFAEMKDRYAAVRNRLMPEVKHCRRPKKEVVPLEVIKVDQPAPPAFEKLVERVNKSIIITRISLKDILLAVTKYFGVSTNSILGQRRTKDVVFPRQIVYYLARELTTLSMPQIARAIGDRDHTSIMHGCRAIAKRIADLDQRTILAIADLKRFLCSKHNHPLPVAACKPHANDNRVGPPRSEDWGGPSNVPLLSQGAGWERAAAVSAPGTKPHVE